MVRITDFESVSWGFKSFHPCHKYVKENNIEIEDNIDRDKCVEQYDGDDPGGSCLIIVKNDDCSFNIIPVSCDSPE